MKLITLILFITKKMRNELLINRVEGEKLLNKTSLKIIRKVSLKQRKVILVKITNKISKDVWIIVI